jgi:selenocysteine lyase/cysteine desulfurase
MRLTFSISAASTLTAVEYALGSSDAVHYASHALVDMAALGADFLVSEVR